MIFNLVDEKWIDVVDVSGVSQTVSLKALFEHSHNFIMLDSDSATQKFAMLRFMLAIVQTVFKREKADWHTIWEIGKFPLELTTYLNNWHERFYLIGGSHPFYQVTEAELKIYNWSTKQPSKVYGKTLNRTISESGNKTSLFSPVDNESKNNLTYPELAKWLITYQGYTGNSEKTIFGNDKYTGFKGWLMSFGAVYLEGDNLFETLMLNYVEDDSVPAPIWERDTSQYISERLSHENYDNLPALYTNLSRAFFIGNFSENTSFEAQSVKLPKIDFEETSIEPMAIWRDYKDGISPKLHLGNSPLWTTLGLIDTFKPTVISRFKNKGVSDKVIKLSGVGAIENFSMSNLIIDEYYDFVDLKSGVLNNELAFSALSATLNTIDADINIKYKKFLNGISQLTGPKKSPDDSLAQVYWEVENLIKDWVVSLDSLKAVEKESELILTKVKLIILAHAKDKVDFFSHDRRMTHGKTLSKDGKEYTENIFTIYDSLKHFLYN